MNKRNVNIDVFKYIASIMIVAIHTTGTFGADSIIGFLVINVLCRVAVPFFAVCSGFLLSYEGIFGRRDKAIVKRIGKQERKLCKLYILWSMVYLFYSIPAWIRSGWISARAFIDYGIAAALIGSHYHLWYLLSLIYALPLLALLVYFLQKRTLIIIAVLLWGMKSVMYGYKDFLPNEVLYLVTILDKYQGIRDAVFCILPLLLIGAIIRNENKKKFTICLIGLLLSFGGLCAEAFMLRSHGQFAVSYIFFTYPTAYFLFHVIADRNIVKKGERVFTLFGSISSIVYYVHPIFGELTNSLIKSNLIHFLLSLICATVFGVIIEFILVQTRRHKAFSNRFLS